MSEAVTIDVGEKFYDFSEETSMHGIKSACNRKFSYARRYVDQHFTLGVTILTNNLEL